MYIITKPGPGVRSEVLAAFELNPQNIVVFDITRGDLKFIDSLRTVGVALHDGKGGTTFVKPTSGQAFIDACIKEYSSAHLSCSDENALERLRRQFPPPDRRRNSVPPTSAA